MPEVVDAAHATAGIQANGGSGSSQPRDEWQVKATPRTNTSEVEHDYGGDACVSGAS